MIFWRPVPARAVNYGAAKRYCVNLSQRSVTLVIVTKSVISHRVSYNVIQCHTGTDLPGPCLGHNNNLGTMLGADMQAMQAYRQFSIFRKGSIQSSKRRCLLPLSHCRQHPSSKTDCFKLLCKQKCPAGRFCEQASQYNVIKFKHLVKKSKDL